MGGGSAVVIGAAAVALTLALVSSPSGAATPAFGALTAPVVIPPMAAVAPRHGQPIRYAALGDSYSSGVGAGDYSGGSCERSSLAFPQLWSALHPEAAVDSVACSDATVASVTATQLDAVTAATTMVTITVGGNDAGFESVMTTCVLEGASACSSAIEAGEAKVREGVQQDLGTLDRAVHSRAPAAQLFAVGYPNLYDLSSTGTCLGLGSSSRAKIDAGIGVLDDAIAAAIRSVGGRFVDPRPAFSGHELCDADPWLHSIDLTEPSASYHPTVDGQTAYLSALVAATG